MPEENKADDKKLMKKPIEKTAVDVAFESENKKLLKDGKYLVRTNSKFAGYQGSTPFIEIDTDWQQMPLDRTTLNIPRENLTRMFPLAYLAGKLSALEQGSKTGVLMILLFIFIIAGLGLTYWTGSSTQSSVQAQLKTADDNNAKKFGDVNGQLSSISNIQMLIAGKVGLNLTEILNNTIPTVGG